MNTNTQDVGETTPVQTWAVPPVDLLRGPEGWQLLVDLPGVTREGLQLQAERGILTLSARRADRPVVGYRRRVRLPEGVDVDGAQAEIRDGVLSVRLPLDERHRGRAIEVQAG